MHFFEYRENELFCDDVKVSELAEKYKTPLYVYSLSTFFHHYKKLDDAFSGIEHLICYSIKSNSNTNILRELNKKGCGFDVVSGGELQRALRAGADPGTIVFAGVGKSDDEIAQALRLGIKMFNVESVPELANIDRIAGREGKQAPVALRLNPDVDPNVHKYITTGKRENKFGLDFVTAESILKNTGKYPNCRFIGVHAHIGSQILNNQPYAKSVSRVADFLEKIGHRVEYFNIGGGFGIKYKDEAALDPNRFAEVILPIVKKYGAKLILEPGRFISGNAGILVTKIQYVKKSGSRVFAICDAGMNDLIRPSLYDAYHMVWPVASTVPAPHFVESVLEPSKLMRCDIVGPICESGDFIALDREIPPVKEGDLLSIFSAGAYGMTMASNYNSRPNPAEVLVHGKDVRLIRKRQTIDDIIAPEEI